MAFGMWLDSNVLVFCGLIILTVAAAYCTYYILLKETDPKLAQDG
jgi:hypothetical protein